MGYDRLKDHLNEHLGDKTAPCLITGCGVSSLPFDMNADGSYGKIVAVDFSSACIDQCMLMLIRDRHPHIQRNKLIFEKQDVRKMDVYVDGSFTNVIDKVSAEGPRDVSYHSNRCTNFRFFCICACCL